MTVLTDFMCICNPEAKKVSEDCLDRVTKELIVQENDYPGGIASAVVYSLEHGLDQGDERYTAGIGSIGCDMWCGIRAYVQKWNPETKQYDSHAEIYVQCDMVEHGLARVWELAKESCAEAG